MFFLQSDRTKKILWILLILSPIAAGFILGLVSSTDVTNLDAWNTVWNDEIGYYRVVRKMRTIGHPTGAGGYNEVLSRNPAWGAYHVLTYLPYVFLSLFTGIDSHNFMVYCNVLLMSLTYFAVVVLLRPTGGQAVWMLVFSCTELIHARYVWSGMSETASIFMTVFVLSCSVWLWKNRNGKEWKVRAVFLLQALLILFFGTIRPYLLAYMVFPVLFLCIGEENLRKKVCKTTALVLSVVCAVWLYVYLRENYCMQYFADVYTEETISGLLKSGQFRQAVYFVLQKNRIAACAVFESFCSGGWVGIVTAATAALIVVMVVGCIRCRRQKHKWDVTIVCSLFIGVTILVYEAVILLYSHMQLHRMLLASLTGGAVLCGLLFGHAECAVHRCITVVLTGWCILMQGRSVYALPQSDAAALSWNEKNLRSELEQVLPFDDSDIWNLTIAALPQSHNLKLRFYIPNYIATNTCNEAYLYTAIEQGTLKSKYILAAEENKELQNRCEAYMRFVWQGCGYRIYQK